MVAEFPGDNAVGFGPFMDYDNPMNQDLVIVAKIEAKAGQVERAKEALKGLIAPTLAEAGCIQYDLHQDHENSAVFLFYERWETRELWQDHMNSAHIKAFLESTEDALASVAVHEMGKVS